MCPYTACNVNSRNTPLSFTSQLAAGRISVVAAAGINASCAADVVEACTSQAMLLPVDAPPVWLHMSGSSLVPTAADPSLQYSPVCSLYRFSVLQHLACL
jgi:hypothetical protein